MNLINISFLSHISISNRREVEVDMEKCKKGMQNIAQNQSFAQKEIGVKYIDYDYSPTQLFQYFQAFDFNIFTYYIIILFCIFNII